MFTTPGGAIFFLIIPNPLNIVYLIKLNLIDGKYFVEECNEEDFDDWEDIHPTSLISLFRYNIHPTSLISLFRYIIQGRICFPVFLQNFLKFISRAGETANYLAAPAPDFYFKRLRLRLLLFFRQNILFPAT